MSDKLSVLVLNPFSGDVVEKNDNFFGLKKYSLDIHGGIKHFLREMGVGKQLVSDEEYMKNLLQGGTKSELLKIIKSYCSKNTSVHFVFPLNYFDLYHPFLESWSLENKLFLHLVCDNLQQDLCKVEAIEQLATKNDALVIASLSQEGSVFNEDYDWRELQKFYDEIGFFQIQTSFSASEYLKKGIEEGKSKIDPVSFINSQALEDGDICLVGELDQERIAAVSKVFEVSKREDKSGEFNNYNPIFITKNLPNLELFVVKSPYSLYENHVLIEKEIVSTLPEKFSNNEVRMVQLGDKKHLKLLNKYLNNEKGVVFDGHKKVRCEDKYNEDGNLAVSSNELLLKRLSDDINNFEVTILSFEDNNFSYVEEFLYLTQQNGIDVILVDVPSNSVYSTLDFSKKNLNGEILNKCICEILGL